MGRPSRASPRAQLCSSNGGIRADGNARAARGRPVGVQVGPHITSLRGTRLGLLFGALNQNVPTPACVFENNQVHSLPLFLFPSIPG